MNPLHWLDPGMKIKRWILLGIAGVFSTSIGIAYILKSFPLGKLRTFPLLFILLGMVLMVIALRQGFISLISCLGEGNEALESFPKSLSPYILKEKIKIKGPKIVVIGGGTGSSVLLRGLKKYTSNITAIVTVADDGGSSGKLREDLGMLPPGDIRSCILALADTEPTMEKLLQYRFKEGSLKGQSFGNLFIAAMNEITGNFEEAVRKTSDVLKVKGTVLPVTLEDIILYAELKNGEIVKGESQIPIVAKEKGQKIKRVSIEPSKVEPLQYGLKAIREADAIILGPGSLYTSIIPNLLVDGIGNEISQSKALKIYVSNIMTQSGETDGYSVGEHIEAIVKHAGNIQKPIIDYVIANNGEIPDYLIEKYKREDSSPVTLKEEVSQSTYQYIIDNFVEIKKHYLRHDTDKVAKTIFQLIADEKLIWDKTRLLDYNYIKSHLREKNNKRNQS